MRVGSLPLSASVAVNRTFFEEPGLGLVISRGFKLGFWLLVCVGHMMDLRLPKSSLCLIWLVSLKRT